MYTTRELTLLCQKLMKMYKFLEINEDMTETEQLK